MSVDGEQSGGGEPVADLGAVETSLHHIDEDAGDVVAVVGVVSDVLGKGHGSGVLGTLACQDRTSVRFHQG